MGKKREDNREKVNERNLNDEITNLKLRLLDVYNALDFLQAELQKKSQEKIALIKEINKLSEELKKQGEKKDE